MQTAVNFLLKYIEPSLTDEQKHFFSIVIEQAKEMEKQQIMDAYIDRMDCTSKEEMRRILGGQYYNETYGSKGSDETKQ